MLNVKDHKSSRDSRPFDCACLDILPFFSFGKASCPRLHVLYFLAYLYLCLGGSSELSLLPLNIPAIFPSVYTSELLRKMLLRVTLETIQGTRKT